MLNDGSVYNGNLTLLQEIIALKRRVKALEQEEGGGEEPKEPEDPYLNFGVFTTESMPYLKRIIEQNSDNVIQIINGDILTGRDFVAVIRFDNVAYGSNQPIRAYDTGGKFIPLGSSQYTYNRFGIQLPANSSVGVYKSQSRYDQISEIVSSQYFRKRDNRSSLGIYPGGSTTGRATLRDLSHGSYFTVPSGTLENNFTVSIPRSLNMNYYWKCNDYEGKVPSASYESTLCDATADGDIITLTPVNPVTIHSKYNNTDYNLGRFEFRMPIRFDITNESLEPLNIKECGLYAAAYMGIDNSRITGPTVIAPGNTYQYKAIFKNPDNTPMGGTIQMSCDMMSWGEEQPVYTFTDNGDGTGALNFESGSFDDCIISARITDGEETIMDLDLRLEHE